MESSVINIILAEEHHVLRYSMRKMLEIQKDMNILDDVRNVDEVFELLSTGMQPDVLITDINLSEADELSTIEKLISEYNNLKVLILSMVDGEEFVLKALKTGVKGYVLKNVNPDELMFAIRHVFGGDNYVCSELTNKFVQHLLDEVQVTESDLDSVINFSAREMEVLLLLADGFTSKEIADKLFTSKRTVEGYRENMITKTGVRNTAALIRYAVAKKIIQ
ncbi:MAG: response regulator transcription factor [Mucilaginibacter sp.]|nr:response regulator transcription factor [Mucilaginibacter sp.]